MENKKAIASLVLLAIVYVSLLVSLGVLSAEEFTLNYSTSNAIQFRELKYDPYPVVPGEYFDIWISVQGREKASDWTFELVPEYPFSLDQSEDPVRDYGDADFNSIVLKYKVRVADDALDGTYDLRLKYDYNLVDYYYTFDIDVEDSRTDFDAVIQDTSDSEVSIAIANIGKYTANSVVVRIPEQDNFVATGTDGQMVGNLDSGDYTIVSFSISQLMQRNTQAQDRDGTSEPEIYGLQIQKSNLKFDIYYTDALGGRRIVNMSLPLQMSSGMNLTGFSDGQFPSGFKGRNIQSNSSWWSNWYFLLIALVAAGVIFFLSKKYPRQTKNIYTKLRGKSEGLAKSKKQNKNDSGTVPDWVKNFKEKKK